MPTQNRASPSLAGRPASATRRQPGGASLPSTCLRSPLHTPTPWLRKCYLSTTPAPPSLSSQLEGAHPRPLSTGRGAPQSPWAPASSLGPLATKSEGPGSPYATWKTPPTLRGDPASVTAGPVAPELPPGPESPGSQVGTTAPLPKPLALKDKVRSH